MLFIDAINKATSHTSNHYKRSNKDQKHPIANYQDSVNLSSAANEVKEIYLNNLEKKPLDATYSLFANLIEHLINYLVAHQQTLHSPESLNLKGKSWMLSLQAPPMPNDHTKIKGNYSAPEISKHPPAKPLLFHIPIKPLDGSSIEITVLVSPNGGSPETHKIFHTFPQENRLSTLEVPYDTTFLNEQTTHYHISLDQDGEPDQLLPLYGLLDENTFQNNISTEVSGLRVWHIERNHLTPVILGDQRVGLLFVNHHKVLKSPLAAQFTREY